MKNFPLTSTKLLENHSTIRLQDLQIHLFRGNLKPKKRQINHPLMELLSSNVTLCAAARILRVNPKTVA